MHTVMLIPFFSFNFPKVTSNFQYKIIHSALQVLKSCQELQLDRPDH